MDGVTVHWYDRHAYLKCVFTIIFSCAQNKVCHIPKFVSFVNYTLWTRVMGEPHLKPIITLYHGGVKQLLGVRMSACNEACYLELGMTHSKPS